MDKVTSATFQSKFNQVNHEVEIYLDSSAGENTSDVYPINPNSIVNLTIEDTLADWIVRGTLTFFYNPEIGPKTINPKTGNTYDATTNINTPKPKSFYNFRNDGLDLLRIRVVPTLANSNLPNTLTITNSVHWSLSYLFSIYDAEDIDLPPGAQNQAAASIKCLKLYFWDSWYQKMITNTMEYSTGLSLRTINDPQYYNSGVLPTGQAIKEIINCALGNNNTQANDLTTAGIIDPALKFNYEPTGTDKDWEDGAAKIFYTAPAQATAYESLMYVYERHVSNEAYSIPPSVSAPRGGTPDTKLYDYSILLKDRGPKETDIGYLTLKPVTSYFKKAGKQATTPGEYQIEHFFLQGYTDLNSPTKTLRGPISENNSDTIDFKSLTYSTISNYRFVDISALTNSTTFVSTPVYSFDFKNRSFNVDFKVNSIESARKFMQEKYIKELYKSESSSLDKLFLIAVNNDKKSKNIHPAFSLHGDNPAIRQHNGLQKLLYVGLFQNAAINFRTLGLSFREPGRFIAIDRTQGVDSGDFEDKFYGQWFIINVKHIFESEIYYNDITAIKIHRFEELTDQFPGLLTS